MDIRPIASGSSGNAYWISDGKTPLLLDAGIPMKAIQIGCGFRVRELGGCFITHCHGDHSKAAKDLLRYGVDVYTGQGTAEACRLISIHALREEGDSKNRDKISIFKQIIQHSARI